MILPAPAPTHLEMVVAHRPRIRAASRPSVKTCLGGFPCSTRASSGLSSMTSSPVADRDHELDLRTVVDAVALALTVVAAWYLVVPLSHLVLGRGDADAEIAGM